MDRSYVGDIIAHVASHLRFILGAALIGTFALTSCADGQSTAQDDQTATAEPSESQHGDTLVAEVDEPVEFETCTKAEEDGATVEWLEDSVIEEQEIAGVESQTVEVDGQEVEIPGTQGIVIPEIVGQAGCIIEYPAPGGCLPAVEISGSYIPGYRIPERTLAEVELPDGTVVEEAVQPAVESEAIERDGAYQEQVCQTESEDASDGEFVSHVIRPHILRSHILAHHSMASQVNRSDVHTDSGELVHFENLPSYQVPSISVGSASVESGYLESYRVEGADHTEYATKDETVSYTTEGDVLFDSDDHQLRSDAASELAAIAEDIALRDGEYTITVEGHTDDLSTQEYADNIDLSEQRAESVVAWLQDNADVAAEDITAAGMGDEHPRASNDSEDGRQANRRVVITVTPTDYEPDIDYETEGSAGDE